MQSISLPDDVKFIIDTITKAGYEAYAVGGCIRDSLLGKTPDDYDITTSAMPETIKSLFRRTIDTGLQHGTVTVMVKDKGYEITTYRIDGEYEDGRHPSEVIFTRSLEEDLKRRDFTINAMAYNDTCGLVDIFGGIQDLEDGIIRCVGNPEERFSEDALRMLRAIRFSAQLGYEIDSKTFEAIKCLCDNISKVSMERIQVELVKTIVSKNPGNIRLAYNAGLTKSFFPEFDEMMETQQNHPHHKYSVGEHTIKGMENIRPDRILRLAMLFHDIGKPRVKVTDENGIDHFHGHPAVSGEMTRGILRRLKFDNDTIGLVRKLVENHDVYIDLTAKSVRHTVNRVGEDVFPLLMELRTADIMAQSDYKREEKLERVEELKKLYTKVVEEGNCLSLKTLAVNGRDLIELGFPKGPALGDELERLLDLVLNNPELNDREILLEMAREKLK